MPTDWLRVVLGIETLYKVHSVVGFPKQSWLWLIYYTVCLLHGYNFRSKAESESITKWTTHLFVISEPWVHS